MSLRRKFIPIAVAAVAILLVVPATTAQAAEHDLEFTNTGGEIQLQGFDPLPVGAAQAGLTGTWDDVTGEFTGTTTINPFAIPANPPDLPVPITLRINPASAENVTGTIDPDTGEADLVASMILEIEVSPTVICSTPAFDVPFTTDPPDGAPLDPLPFDPDADYTIGLVAEFTVPQVTSTGPTGLCPDAVATIANENFPNEATAVLPLERGTPVPPTTSTTTTTAAPSTTAAPAAATRPRLTG
jgi:hypothetical protein